MSSLLRSFHPLSLLLRPDLSLVAVGRRRVEDLIRGDEARDVVGVEVDGHGMGDVVSDRCEEEDGVATER